MASSEVLGEVNAAHADDATWVLTSSFVILTMQSGFAMLEMGSSGKGHEVNILVKNVYDVVCGALAYYLLGYGISYGSPSNAFTGLGDYLMDVSATDPISSGLVFSNFIFQFSFAATSTTIVSGCLAMRCRFILYCLYSFYAVLVYSFVAHWVWSANGWLAQLGVHDFAGSGPVHLVGAVNGLIGILVLGPRHGRFDGTRPPEDFRPSSSSSLLIGLFMLWWGWIGFNCGSSFGITQFKWIVATRAGVTTINATAGGGIAALLYTKAKSRGRQLGYPSVAVSSACSVGDFCVLADVFQVHHRGRNRQRHFGVPRGNHCHLRLCAPSRSTLNWCCGWYSRFADERLDT